MVWPSSSCRTKVRLPCRTPGAPPVIERRVASGVDAVAAGLEPEELHARVVEERVEDADRVRAAADAGGDDVRQPPDELEHLRRAPRRR